MALHEAHSAVRGLRIEICWELEVFEDADYYSVHSEIDELENSIQRYSWIARIDCMAERNLEF